MIGDLTTVEIDHLLRTQQIGRLGVHGDGRTYIFPVAYGYDGRCIYVHSAEGLKVRLMRSCPEVCFEVEDITSPALWRTVIAHGTFAELTAAADREAALAVIVGQGNQPLLPSLAPYTGGPEHVVVYRITLTEVTGRFERDEVLALHGRR
jgi:nitroimidazol reductase NimA-like FMN-containing flavoprotein (pyridoxamine 5'-phosphate oxidase superfamily)